MNDMQEALAKFGDRMTLKNQEGEKPIRAFVSPETTLEEVIPGEKTGIGWLDHRLWKYIGLEEVQPGDTIVWLRTAYRVRNSRAYYFNGELHHWWASLDEEREAAT